MAVTRKLGVPLIASLLSVAGAGTALAEDAVLSAPGPGTLITGFVDGDFGVEAGASTTLGGTTLESESHLTIVDAIDFDLSSVATVFLSTDPTIAAPDVPPVRTFLVDPLLDDATFSQSAISSTTDSFAAFSESWKGSNSGASESTTSAHSLDSQTMGVSGLAADGTTNQSFTQAFHAPEGGPAIFTSATAESSDGGSTYAVSALGRQAGEIDNGDGTTSPFTSNTAVSAAAFEGNGIAHVDALAGSVYTESEISDQFDGETLTGVAEVLSSVLTPNSNADTIIQVTGDGEVVNRIVSNAIDNVGAEDLVNGAIAANAFVSNEVVFDKSATGNSIIETGPSRNVSISNSGQNLQGLVNINQDAGNSNNQANIRSIALSDSPNAVLLNDVNGRISTTDNTVQTNGASRSNVITDNAFANGSGVLGINQSSGSVNQLTNVLALAVGIGENAVAIGDVDLEVEHSDNTLIEDAGNPGSREDRIDGGAFAGFSGVAQVNQVSGDLNQVTSVISVSVSVQ